MVRRSRRGDRDLTFHRSQRRDPFTAERRRRSETVAMYLYYKRGAPRRVAGEAGRSPDGAQRNPGSGHPLAAIARITRRVASLHRATASSHSMSLGWADRTGFAESVRHAPPCMSGARRTNSMPSIRDLPGSKMRRMAVPCEPKGLPDASKKSQAMITLLTG